PEGLRRQYVDRNGEWAHALADGRGLGDACRAVLRRIEDAAYGLRWLEVRYFRDLWKLPLRPGRAS
ncbi:MAG: hypothetical protein M3336_04945, partial [Chloroflexota bacterium]|nr:hypothetical protein [Chloroflexota bacterium]